MVGRRAPIAGQAEFAWTARVERRARGEAAALLAEELKAIDETFDPARLRFSERHLSHAASAFNPSPFEKALALTLDGVGEWPTSSVALGPRSLGLLYSAFTHCRGFKVNSGDYKQMGLARYDRPVHAAAILDRLVDLKSDGSFRLDQFSTTRPA